MQQLPGGGAPARGCGAVEALCPAVQYAEGSTVVDMTASPPAVLREGRGDAWPFQALSLVSA